MKSIQILSIDKKAFTLLEMLIAITIFMIILFFLYKALDDTKHSNQKFENHIYKKEDVNHLYKVIAEDIAESKGIISLLTDKDKNSMVIFKTNNSFNNPFYSNISYIVSSNNHLLRIESKKKFQKEKSGVDFYNNSFIDILVKDVKKFVVVQNEDRYLFIIEPNQGTKVMFTTFKMIEN